MVANSPYLFENYWKLIQDLFIAKPYYPKSPFLERQISRLIGFRLRLMDFPVHLNDQAKGMTIKIHNKTINDMLPAEMPAVQAVGPEVLL